MSKKGLSAVIATVLLILLTVSAVAIVSTFLIPFVNRSLENTSCFEFKEYFKFDDSFGYSCYIENGIRKNYFLTVRAKPDNSSANKIEGFSLRFLGGGFANTVEVIDGRPFSDIEVIGNVGQSNLFVPSHGGRFSVLTYNYTSNNLYDKVEIYPIIKDNKICDQSDSIKLTEC